MRISLKARPHPRAVPRAAGGTLGLLCPGGVLPGEQPQRSRCQGRSTGKQAVVRDAPWQPRPRCSRIAPPACSGPPPRGWPLHLHWSVVPGGKAGTAAVLKGSRQIGVRADSHPGPSAFSFQSFHLGLPSRRLPVPGSRAARGLGWGRGSAPGAAVLWCLRKAAALPWERHPVPWEWGPPGPGAHLNVLLVGQHQDGDTVQRLACDHLLWGEQRGGSERPLSASAQRSPSPRGPPASVDALGRGPPDVAPPSPTSPAREAGCADGTTRSPPPGPGQPHTPNARLDSDSRSSSVESMT